MSSKKHFLLYVAALVIVIAVALFFSHIKGFNWKGFEKKIEIKEIKPGECKPNEDISAEQPADANSASESVQSQSVREYPVHKNISVTLFWAGEGASDDNKQISNKSSAWDDYWTDHYGGVDSSKNRNGYAPAKFTPKENPFYFALPYNDFDKKGERKKDIKSVIPWAKDIELGDSVSYAKNRWIKIAKGDKVAYAQWEDVGPFGENDVSYVFGSAEPQSKTNNHAGLDVSPAVRDYLGISEKDIVNWQFVEAESVPDGPWKKVVTKTNICWK
jgi:hypothetical protein